MPCSDEAHGHDHNGGCEHDHDVPLAAGPTDSLYPVIDTEHVVALNAAGGAEKGRVVIKEWAERDDETVWLQSDCDDSLIVNIPFTASVSLRSITLKPGHGGFRPSEMRVFVNSPGLDFSDAEARTPTQTFDIIDAREAGEYQVKAAKFASTTSISLFFPHNESEGDDEETTQVYYVGLRGSWRPLPGKLGQIVYESAARPSDHKVHDGIANAPRQGL